MVFEWSKFMPKWAGRPLSNFVPTDTFPCPPGDFLVILDKKPMGVVDGKLCTSDKEQYWRLVPVIKEKRDGPFYLQTSGADGETLVITIPDQEGDEISVENPSGSKNQSLFFNRHWGCLYKFYCPANKRFLGYWDNQCRAASGSGDCHQHYIQEKVETVSDFFIPDPGLKFRIISYFNGEPLYTENGSLKQGKSDPPDNSTWWTLVPAERGTYWIKLMNPPRAQYIRLANGVVDVSTSDDWMIAWQYNVTIGASRGKFKGHTVFNQCGDEYLSVNEDSVHSSTGEHGHTTPGQCFDLEFEDMEIFNVEYLKGQTEKHESDVDLIDQTVINDDDSESGDKGEQKVNMKTTTNQTFSFSHTMSLSWSFATSFKVSALFFEASGEQRVGIDYSYQWGTEKSIAKEMGSEYTVKIPPGYSRKLTATCKCTTADIPVLIHSRSKKAKHLEVVTRAMYKSASRYNYIFKAHRPQALFSEKTPSVPKPAAAQTVVAESGVEAPEADNCSEYSSIIYDEEGNELGDEDHCSTPRDEDGFALGDGDGFAGHEAQ